MDPISNIINDKADEIFPTTEKPAKPGIDIIDLEDYTELAPAVEDTTKAEPVPEPTTESHLTVPTDSPIDLTKLKTKIYSIKDQLEAIIRLIEDNQINPNKTTPKETIELEQKPPHYEGTIIEGIFDGEKMIGSDNKEYSVPPNYASKSKLVEGDGMKLTITPNGRFIYKQINQVERIRKIGRLIKDPTNDTWCVEDDGKKYKILTASVTFYKGNPGDEVIFMIAHGQPNSWGAVDNIVKKNA